MSEQLKPQYFSNLWSKNSNSKNNNNNQKKNRHNKKCFFENNLKFIEDFKIELINHSIDLNLYQLIIDICTYINDKKNYSYEYVIYDINSFFDLYNKDISTINNDYLIEFINNIKNNFCLNKDLINRINIMITTFDLDNYRINNEINITSPDFEEQEFDFDNNYFSNNKDFNDNLETKDIEYNNFQSDEDY